jgi:hypothetical protein
MMRWRVWLIFGKGLWMGWMGGVDCEAQINE